MREHITKHIVDNKLDNICCHVCQILSSIFSLKSSQCTFHTNIYISHHTHTTFLVTFDLTTPPLLVPVKDVANLLSYVGPESQKLPINPM